MGLKKDEKGIEGITMKNILIPLVITFAVSGCGGGGGGGGGSSNPPSTTNPPEKPTAPTTSEVSASQIKLEWVAVNRAAHYRLYSSDAESGDYTEIAAAAGEGLTYTHTGLDPNTAYFYKIKACIDDSGDGTCSEFSDAATATTLPAKPETPTATAVSATGIMISWEYG